MQSVPEGKEFHLGFASMVDSHVNASLLATKFARSFGSGGCKYMQLCMILIDFVCLHGDLRVHFGMYINGQVLHEGH